MTITVWPKRYADPCAGVDDDRVRQMIDRDRAGGPLAIGVENRKWCDLIHRGRVDRSRRRHGAQGDPATGSEVSHETPRPIPLPSFRGRA